MIRLRALPRVTWTQVLPKSALWKGGQPAFALRYAEVPSHLAGEYVTIPQSLPGPTVYFPASLPLLTGWVLHYRFASAGGSQAAAVLTAHTQGATTRKT